MQSSSPGLLQRALGTVLRLVLLALGALLGLATLALGLMLAFGLVAWALLRGRRPVLDQAFRWRGGRAGFGGRAGARMPPGEIVDAEVREVHDAHDPRDSRGADARQPVLPSQIDR